MPLDYTHLKVDQTLLHYGNQYLLVSNINIPASQLNDQELGPILQRAQNFIQEDYAGLENNNIYYQVCASYDLRNTATGEIRHWSGSFNPRGNRLNILRDFQNFHPANFQEHVTRACDPNNVYNKLRFFHTQTVWVFDRITSAIISIQARVGPLHPTVERRGLLAVRNGHHHRIHITFLLA